MFREKLIQAQTTCGQTVWVNVDCKVGDMIKSPDGFNVYQVVKILTNGYSNPEVTLERLVEVNLPPADTTETIPAMDLEFNDEFFVDGGWARVTGTNKTQGRYYIYVDCESLETGRRMPSQRIPKSSKMKIKSREVITMLALQNAIEGVRKLDSALVQMLDISNLVADAEGKVSLQNSNIKVAKEVLARAARDEMQVAKSQLNELVKKL